MKTAQFRVICNIQKQTYTIKAMDPLYKRYDAIFTNIGVLMQQILKITNELRAQNVKAVFTFEY